MQNASIKKNCILIRSMSAFLSEKNLLFHSVRTFYQKAIVTLNFCLKKIPESIMCDSCFPADIEQFK